jgi:hypothetical protein
MKPKGCASLGPSLEAKTGESFNAHFTAR